MTTPEGLKIGDAAATLGIAAHVLRHWESVGLLTPARSPAGHRSYDEQTLDRARLIRTLQRTGLSLEQIRGMALAAHDDRIALIEAKRAEIRDRIGLLRATERFLAHVRTCRHPVISECPDCARFVTRQFRPGDVAESVVTPAVRRA
ncbi:MerR family transcriptional regulator [Nocardia blacklockiae]|uniref:MerR family transcriptional regulator n=1 Tax=Nocardia blacklockiae TaxID=480036 RepID=UPI001894D51D|nr:MerR family transcriptional regulator [Nocardia blacklockiae]MBF6174784.1 MerR family transcriptional regulator [Nocardia blacklockiae]